MYQYYVRSLGATPVVIDSFIDLTYTKKMHDVGMATITVRRNHPAVSALALDDEIEIWRQINGVNQVDFRGFARGGTYRTLEDGRTVYEIFVAHEQDLLRRSINAYKAGQFAASEWSIAGAATCMAAIVYNNYDSATVALATTANRLSQATSRDVNVQTFGLSGTRISNYSNAYKSVLTILQELSAVDKSVFVLRKSGSFWLVSLYEETFATDRRSSLFFDVDVGNIREAELNQVRANEPTVGFVLGQKEGTDRVVEVRTTATRDVSTNNFEIAIDARHLSNVEAMQAYGDSVLTAARYRPKLTFRPVQLAGLNYGQHYFWGDIVTARYNGQSFVQRIAQVTIRRNGQGEAVDLTLEDIA